MSVFRCYSQKKPGFDVEAQGVCKALQEQLGINGLKSVAILNRYDADQIDPAVYEQAKGIVFSEPMVDVVFDETFPATEAAVLAVEALPGQFDQRADSCAQCIQLMAGVERPLIAYTAMALRTAMQRPTWEPASGLRVSADWRRDAYSTSFAARNWISSWRAMPWVRPWTGSVFWRFPVKVSNCATFSFKVVRSASKAGSSKPRYIGFRFHTSYIVNSSCV